MKNFTKFLFVFFAFIFCSQHLFSQFTSGRLVVLKTSGSSSKAGAQITLQEYQTNGSVGTSVVLPNSGGNPIQLSSGSGATEGFLTKSPDGKYLVLAGYSTSASPITDITTTSPGTTPRIIYSINASGNYSQIASSTSFYPSGSEVRAAVTDGTNYWMSGNTSSTTDGITYFGPGTKVAFGTGATPIKSYSLQIFNNQLYYSTQKSGPSNTSGQLGIFALGSGLPTSGTPTATQIINTGTAKPGDFSFSPDGKTCYVSIPVNSSIGGIRKYTNSTAWATSGWTLAYTIGSGVSNIGVLGMTVDYSGAKPVIYATTYEDNVTGNRLIKVTDNGTLATASISTLVSSSPNTWLHGVSFAPCDAPSSISVSSNGPVCEGATINLTSSASGSADLVYSWTGPNGFTSSSQNPTINSSTIAASGTYNLTISNACGSTSGSTSVTVNAKPTAFNVTGGGGFCSGSPGTDIGLSGSQSGVNYQLKDGGTNFGSPVSGTGSALTLINTSNVSTYSVLATVNSTGCSSTMIGSATVTADQNYIADILIVNNQNLPNEDGYTFCAGNISLNVEADQGDNFTYSWSGPNGFSSSVKNPTILNATSASSGTYTISLTNSCGTKTGSFDVIVNSVPSTYSVTGGGSYCQNGAGVAIGLSNSEVGVNYQLKADGSDNGSPIAGTGSALSFGNKTAAATYTVVATNATSSCSNTMSGNAVVTITPSVTPTVTISSNVGDSICIGTNVTLTANITNGGSTPSYQWKYNGANVGTNKNTYSISSLTNGKTISCVLTSNATCASSSTVTSNVITFKVTSKATPTVSIASNAGTSVCNGQNVTFTATPTSGGSSPAYQWKLNGSNIATGSTYATSSLSNADVITCALTSNYGCVTTTSATSNSLTMTVTNNVTPSLIISSNLGNTICAGTNVTFSATPTNGGGSPSYQWKKNGSNIATGATYSSSALSNNDQISCVLTPSLQCLTQATATSNQINLTVKPTSSSDTTATACGSFNWYGTVYSSGGDKTRTLVSSNGCDSIVTLHLTINALPTAYNVTGGGSYCQNGAGVAVGLSNSTSGVSYQLKNGASNVGSPIAGTGSSLSFGNITDAGTYTVLATTNATGCSNTMSSNAVVVVSPNVTPTVTISSNVGDSICIGTNVTLTASITNGGSSPSYQWKLNGSNTGSNRNTYSISSLTNGKTISCVITSNATCKTTSTATSNVITFKVTSKSTPTLSIATSGGNSICDGSSKTFTSSGTFLGTSPTYDWKINGTSTDETSSTFTTTSLANSDQVTCSVVSNYGCLNTTTANSNTLSMTVIENITPTVSVSSDKGTEFCNSPVTFTATPSSLGNISYVWKVNGSNVGNTTDTYQRNSPANGEIVSCTITTDYVCKTASTADDALTLTVWEATTGDTTATACSTFDWYGDTYTSTGVYSHQLQTIHGCDSIVSLHLTINQPSTGDTSATVCQSFTWYENTYTTTGDYTRVIPNAVGCDSTITLHLTIIENITPSVTVSSDKGVEFCNTTATFTASPTSLGTLTYDWKVNGSSIGNTSDTYERETSTDGDVVSCTITTDYECVTTDNASDQLTLTVWEAATGDTTATACTSFDWYGETYTSSGVYTHPFQTVHGCDSIVTLNLTINLPSESDTTATACQTFTWYDNTYTTSGDYTRIIPNAFGCDSTITLHLTINDTTYSITTVSAINSYYWNNRTYYASGFYKANFASLLNAVGCDSSAYLNLTLDFQTKIKDAQCNTTVASFGTPVLANSIPSGTQAYMFKVQRGAFVQEIERTTNYFTMSMITGVKNGQTYNVSVKVKRGDVWYNYSDVCTITTPPYPTTQVKSTQCNTTVAALNTAIGVDLVSGVTGYRVKVVEGSNTQTVDKLTNTFNLWDLTSKPLYDKTYAVSVALIYADTVTGYGSVCNITTPSSFQIGTCNAQVPLMTSLIKSTVFSGAQAYRIKLVNGSYSDSIEGTSYYTSFSKFTNIDSRTYGTTYNFSVKVKFNNVWNEYSASCPITAQAMPLGISSATCNVGSFTSTTKITANTVTGATKYKFVLFNGSTAVDSTTVTSASILANAWKKFTCVANSTYGIRVAVEYKGTFTALSDACSLTYLVPSPFAKETISVSSSFASIYPNPYTESIQFHEDLSDAVYSVNVFDITGKLVDSFEGNLNQLNAKRIGSSYISGVYTIQLTKLDETKVFRVIKE